MLGNEAIGRGGRDCSVLGDTGDAGDATGFVHVVIFSLSSGTQKGERSCRNDHERTRSARTLTTGQREGQKR